MALANDVNPVFEGQMRCGTLTALGTTGTVTVNPEESQVFSITPTAAVTLDASNVEVGQIVYLVVTTSGTTSYDITFGTNFKSTGVLATGTTTGKVFTVTFVSDGTNLNEVSRTAAM